MSEMLVPEVPGGEWPEREGQYLSADTRDATV